MPFFRGKEITERFQGKVEVSTELFISREKFEDIKRKYGAPKPGDLLLTSVGTLGSVYVVRPEDEFYFKDGNLTWFRNLQGVESKFLYYWFQSPAGRAELRKCTIGSSQPALTIVLLKEMEIDVPSLDEQRRIVGILSAYDDLIENCQRRIQILEEMARRLYREWFVHFRYPGHESIPFVTSSLGSIPQGWEVKKLGEVLELAYGKALKQENRKGGPVAVYGSSGIVGWHDEALTTGPGIVVGRKGNVGSIFWSPTDFFVIDTAYYVVSTLPLRFLFHELQGKNFINNDSAVPGLSRQQAYSLELALPPASLLSDFAVIVKSFHEQAENLELQIANLRMTRDLILPRLLKPPTLRTI